MVVALEVVFWLSLAGLFWTHVGYPVAAAVYSRVRPRPIRAAVFEPTVAVIVAAYNEETVIARRLDNLLALDYPRGKLELVVSSDASSDRTEEIALQYPGVKVISNPRGGKVAAQDRAVRQTTSDIVAFSDANCTWAPGALRTLVRAFADPEVAYACGELRLVDAAGDNKEGVYWRYEMAVREAESRLGSVTGGNGSIYAVRRSDYVEVDPRFGHDLSLPYLMVQHGRRAVFEPGAHAFEKPTPTNETEYRRKVRMAVRALLADRPTRANVQAARPRLRDRDLLAPPPSLQLGTAARRAARDVDRADRAGMDLRSRPGRPAWASARGARRRRHRALLHARVGRDPGRSLELHATRSAGDVGSGRGDAVGESMLRPSAQAYAHVHRGATRAATADRSEGDDRATRVAMNPRSHFSISKAALRSHSPGSIGTST